MAKQIIEFPLDSGGAVHVEVENSEALPAQAPTSFNTTIQKAETSFEQATQNIRPIANNLLNSLQALDVSPDEISVNFGLRFEGGAGVILASTSTAASCNVTLRWKKST